MISSSLRAPRYAVQELGPWFRLVTIPLVAQKANRYRNAFTLAQVSLRPELGSRHISLSSWEYRDFGYPARVRRTESGIAKVAAGELLIKMVLVGKGDG